MYSVPSSLDRIGRRRRGKRQRSGRGDHRRAPDERQFRHKLSQLHARMKGGFLAAG